MTSLATAIAAARDAGLVITPSVQCDTFAEELADARFLTRERILDNTVNMLLPLLRPKSFRGRRYSVVDVANAITYACSNSTPITAAWLDSGGNSIVVEIDPLAGTVGTMELVIPKKIATGINRALFDGQEMTDNGTSHARDLRIAENTTHTTVSISYSEDFKRIELQAARVIPEFGSATIAIITVASIVAIIVGARMKMGRKKLG